MSTFVSNNVSSGAVVYASDHNTMGALVAAVVNGGLDDANINASAAIAGTKLATDGVTDTQLDYPRWYQEIIRTTLGVAGDTITVSSIPARKYLKIVISLVATGGTLATTLRFNSDSASNYSLRLSDNGAAHGTFTSQSGITLEGAGSTNILCEMDILNIIAQEKLCRFETIIQGTAGAGNVTASREGFPKWVNTSAQISRIDVTNAGAGDFAIGSEIIVLGHD